MTRTNASTAVSVNLFDRIVAMLTVMCCFVPTHVRTVFTLCWNNIAQRMRSPGLANKSSDMASSNSDAGIYDPFRNDIEQVLERVRRNSGNVQYPANAIQLIFVFKAKRSRQIGKIQNNQRRAFC
jgi:hypothetical protein